MNDDAPETILTNVVAVLEEHSKILLYNRQAIELLSAEIAKMKQRLDKLESENSLKSDDAKFIEDITERLKAISKAVKEKV